MLHFLVSIILSTMFDIGDLPVLTFGNCVLKAEWLRGQWNYTFFWDVAHVFSNTGVYSTDTVITAVRRCIVRPTACDLHGDGWR